MEWHEIEEKLQKKVSENEVIPSAEAWNKLATQLDEYNAVKKKLSLKFWIGIAASLLIGGFFGSSFLFRQNEMIVPYVIQQDTSNAIVETDSVKVESKKKEIEEALHKEDKSTIPLIKENYKRVEALQQTLAQKEELPVTVSNLNEDVKEKEPIVVELLPISVVKPTQKVVVNSKDLLKQVEGEIVVEYRESVVKKIYEKTKKVVVDISDSNYEK
ncbi:MAG: hypothetical protein LBE34_06120 [Flavobacteriaceae bacterium]|jgi:hypothetical protein|nr:hypothetical protein [Flavobacteriaceae bacterium]